MSGRLIASVLADFMGWRWSVAVVGAIGLASAAIFWKSLPESRYFTARPLRFGALIRAYGSHLTDTGLPWLFFLGFLLMGSFVTLYNYLQYRLTAPPFGLSQTWVGVLFSVYLVGIVASTAAGSLSDRFGRRKVLWIMIAILVAGLFMTRSDSLVWIVLGTAVFTFGFFAAHSVASSWIGRRARHSKAQASSLYLFSYYIGSSVVGSSAGMLWTGFGWDGIVWLLAAMQVLAFLVALRMAALKPLPIPEVAQPPAAGV
jgi:YNFM family putative membrane transporter